MGLRLHGRVFALLSLVACHGSPEAGPRASEPVVTMPGPAPLQREGDAVASNDACVACHAEIAAEWQGSLHREAYTSREFQSALRREPLGFCRGCHAPEADPRRPEPALAAIGVACVTCHVPAGTAVLSARARDEPSAAAHPVLRAAAFAGPDACAGCHEFAFPDRRPVTEHMQTTIREHAASPQRDRSCADCHMPRAADGHRSHAFLASRDDAWMRGVIEVRAIRPAADRVELTLDLRDGQVGHAFPTGDLLRRLTVQVIGEGTRQRRYLARHWRMARLGKGMPVQSEAGDDRLGVGEGPRVLVFELGPDDATRAVRWRVDYERVESFVGGTEDGAVVTGAIKLADGVLPALD